jgi:hypothetical protein
MGWSGDDDAWYDLPDIDSSPDYSSVYKCVYNIHITDAGDGEMISGRVLDSNGNPIPNPTVYAEPNGESYGFYAESDSKGIYAFDCLDSDTTYTVCPQMDGYVFSSQQVSTGTSIDSNSTSGNVWGIDFYGQALEITNITPASGPTRTYMKIEGQNFGNSPGIVMFSGGPENGEEVQWSDTVVYCRVPDDAVSGDVKIQTAQFHTSTGRYFEVTSPNEVLVDPNNATPNIENGTAEYPFSTIRRGMNATTAGNTVIVNPGIYTEVVDFNGAAITLSSLNPEDPCIVAVTILDGNSTRTVITFDDGEDANSILTGFTIRDGNQPGDGGGIYCTNASPTISHCVIKNNRNSDGNGGGMHNSHSDPTLNKCTFINNTASSYGGAIDNYESSPTLRDCTFIGNSAVDGGGAVYNNSNSNAIIINCVFISNSATDERGNGGAVYNFSSCPKIFNCTFCGNSANGVGGAMYSLIADFTLTIINSTFSGNSAQEDGGAIYNDLAGPTLINCTLSGNEAGDTGDGIFNLYNNYYYNATLTNCILWGNGSEEIYDSGSATVVTYSDIKGGWSGSGTNNIDSDPNFVRDPNDGGDGWGTGGNDDFGDLHFLPGSPCIDASDNTAVPADTADLDGDGNTTEPTPWDFDGHKRFIDDPCTDDSGNGTAPFADMGADEYSYLGDLNFSGCVNFVDFAMFAPHWWESGCGTCDRADLTGDGEVDFSDLREFAANWLAGCEP